MTEYKHIFDKNIDRVNSIISLYSSLKKENQKDKKNYTLTDILRAAVVFLHSSFEEYFRSVLIKWLPTKADDHTLKEIPISLHSGNKRADKIFLDELAKYREKTIDEVIRQSVEGYMALKSFNSQEEIRSWLSKITIDVEKFTDFELIDWSVIL